MRQKLNTVNQNDSVFITPIAGTMSGSCFKGNYGYFVIKDDEAISDLLCVHSSL